MSHIRPVSRPLMLTLLLAIFSIPLFFFVNESYADDSITVTISGNPTITVAPTNEGTFADSGNINISVSNAPASGYTLAITGSNNTNLVGKTDNTKSITSISSALDQATFNTSTYNNKWGYKPSMHYNTSTEQRANNSNYLPAPDINGDIIDVTNDNSSNNYTLSIGARVSSDLGFQTYENNTFVIAAVGNSKCNRAATTINEAICMQDINDDVINSMVMNQQYTLTDERDNKDYYIAKMKDGRVWMTQNLDLDLISDTTAENYVALTSENTNLTTFNNQNYTVANGYSCSNASTTTNCTANGETIIWVPSGTTLAKSAASSWSNNNYTPYSYDYEDYYYYTDTSGSDTAYDTESACTSAHNDGTCPHYHVGNYYNFTAAVASNSTSGITSSRTVMGNSICPAGWRLPNGRTSLSSSDVGYNGEFNYTLVAQGVISGYVGTSNASYNTNGYLNLSNNPLYLVRSGYKNGTSDPSSMGGAIYYQTSTILGSNSFSSSIYGPYFSSSYVYPNTSNYRNYGYPIRCVAEQSNTGTTTITFDKNASDATGTMSSQTYNANTLNTLSSNSFSRSGYLFNSWNTEADGSGASYANDAQFYVASGTNTNNVTLYAQWDKAYTVTFATGSNVTGIVFDGTTYTNGQTVQVLPGSSYSISGSYNTRYAFSGWSSTAGTFGNSSYQNTTFSTTANATITLTGQYVNTEIKTLTTSTCPTTPTPTYDNRDNEVYWVAKLADNKCWMLDNLRLDPTSVSLAGLQGKTNASNTTLGYLKNGGGSSPYNTTAVANKTSEFYQYNQAQVNINYKNNTTTSYGSGSGKIGVYYNYCAASAGSYCYASGAATGNVSEDLCPANWHSSSSDEYVALYNAYSRNQTNFKNAFSTPLSGYFYGSSAYDQGSYGRFWSSTYKDGRSPLYMFVFSSGVTESSYSTSDNRNDGYSLRCLLSS